MAYNRTGRRPDMVLMRSNLGTSSVPVSSLMFYSLHISVFDQHTLGGGGGVFFFFYFIVRVRQRAQTVKPLGANCDRGLYKWTWLDSTSPTLQSPDLNHFIFLLYMFAIWLQCITTCFVTLFSFTVCIKGACHIQSYVVLEVSFTNKLFIN